MDAGAARRVLVLEGEPGAWLPDGFEVIAQRGAGLAERLAHAVADVGEPLLIVGMDTPQLTRALLSQALDALGVARHRRRPRADARRRLLGDRAGAPDPAVFDGVPMSTARTAAAQRARLHELGVATTELATLRDVDDYADATAVATLAPWSRFAAAYELLGVTG